MTRRLVPPLLLLAVLTACSGDGEGPKGQDALSPSPSTSIAAPAGDALPRCEQVVREGAPVSAQLLTTGCQDESGSEMKIDVTECPDGRRVATFEGLRGEVGNGTWKKGAGDACAA